MADRFRFGIEEEYFLADAETGRSPTADAAERFHASAEAKDGASRELLIGQVEVQTPPLDKLEDAHETLRHLRRDLAGLAAEAGLRLIAAGSQPFAQPMDQIVTDKTRYRHLAAKVGAMAERVIVCALHVHVEVPEPERRIAVMNQLVPFLPLLLALSVSSPFWQGANSGLRGFRLAAFAEWPHMGLPVHFENQQDYARFIEVLVTARVIPDASFIWWLIRPSAHFPTLELRICDSCTRAEDAVAIAALYRSLVCAAALRPGFNGPVDAIHWGVTTENIWQVQHLGLDARLIDAGTGQSRTIAESLEAAIAAVAPETAQLGDEAWVARTREILARGTSADRQLRVFRDASAAGEAAALRAVMRHLAEETVT